ncbi:MAG: serine/threonine-protein kinase [Planctomycetaceae bacterium]
MNTESQTSTSGYFCPGCNSWYDAGDLSTGGYCGRCGLTILQDATVATHQPTQLWKRPADAAATNSHDTDEDELALNSLIGRPLHIYQLESLLGRGGMGWVFLGRHEDLHRSCAIKVLAPKTIRSDPDYLTRFENEGRAAAALVHPNIVTTHAIGCVDQWHFLEMEFVRGRSLQQRLREGPLSCLHAMSIAAQVANGLAAAHAEGIVHRDLKPDNILITHQKIPKITDFGLAKRVGSQSNARILAGTPHYMAPELFLGHEPSPASDVYALGVCLYQMITGRYPFTAPRLSELMYKVVNDRLPHLRLEFPSVPLDISECVLAMLARSPVNRPASGIEAAQLLLAVLGHARDIETLLHDALDSLPDLDWSKSGPRYVVDVCLRDDRRQQVFIEADASAAGERLVAIYSVCGPVDSGFLAEALRMNATISHGALAIRDIEESLTS